MKKEKAEQNIQTAKVWDAPLNFKLSTHQIKSIIFTVPARCSMLLSNINKNTLTIRQRERENDWKKTRDQHLLSLFAQSIYKYKKNCLIRRDEITKNQYQKMNENCLIYDPITLPFWVYKSIMEHAKHDNATRKCTFIIHTFCWGLSQSTKNGKSNGIRRKICWVSYLLIILLTQ